MAIKPPKKEKLTGILAIAVYLVSGLLLLFKPDLMNELSRWIAVVVLGLYAIFQAVKYFRTPPEEAAAGYRLSVALVAGTVALLAFTNNSLLNNHMWGLLLMCAGFVKFQTAWDFYRLGHSRWWWFMIVAAVSLCFGVLILTDVVVTGITVFMGIALVLEAILDIVVLLMVNNSEKFEAMADRRAEKRAKKKAEKQAAEEAAKAEAEKQAAEEAAKAEAEKQAAEEAARAEQQAAEEAGGTETEQQMPEEPAGAEAEQQAPEAAEN